MKHQIFTLVLVLIVSACAEKSFSQTVQNNYLKGGNIGGYASAEFSGELKTTPGENIMLSSVLLVYPNPAHEFIDIEYFNFHAETTIQILSTAGTVVQEFDVENTEYMQRISLYDLPAGMYLIKVFSEVGDVAYTSFVKQ